MEIKDRKTFANGGEVFTVILDNGVEIKDCKVANGKNGPFVSGPSRKGKDDKWFNMVYFPSEVGNAIIGLLTPDVSDADEDVPF